MKVRAIRAKLQERLAGQFAEGWLRIFLRHMPKHSSFAKRKKIPTAKSSTFEMKRTLPWV